MSTTNQKFWLITLLLCMIINAVVNQVVPPGMTYTSFIAGSGPEGPFSRVWQANETSLDGRRRISGVTSGFGQIPNNPFFNPSSFLPIPSSAPVPPPQSGQTGIPEQVSTSSPSPASSSSKLLGRRGAVVGPGQVPPPSSSPVVDPAPGQVPNNIPSPVGSSAVPLQQPGAGSGQVPFSAPATNTQTNIPPHQPVPLNMPAQGPGPAGTSAQSVPHTETYLPPASPFPFPMPIPFPNIPFMPFMFPFGHRTGRSLTNSIAEHAAMSRQEDQTGLKNSEEAGRQKRSIDGTIYMEDDLPQREDLISTARVFEAMEELDEDQCLLRLICEAGADPKRFGYFGKQIVIYIRSLKWKNSSLKLFQSALRTGAAHSVKDCQERFHTCSISSVDFYDAINEES